jgi:DUF1365 family protein
MPGRHSALYVGRVAHQRLRPRRHRLCYRVFYLLLDLDELEALASASWLFRRGRFGLVSFHARDHGDGSDLPLRLQAETLLRSAGVDVDGGPIRLLTLPRILGFAFNPISVYLCHRRDDALAAVLYEVTNTFGDRHTYLVKVDSSQAPIRQGADKAMHVSPFLDMALRYTFHLSPPADTLALAVAAHDDVGPVLAASLTATRRPLTDRSLARVLLAFPLMTVKVVAAIHWEALRLWLKRIAIRARPEPPAKAVTIGWPLPRQCEDVADRSTPP